MDGDGTAVVLHAMDARAGERERIAGGVLADAALPSDDERLVARAAFEHMDADTRAAVVVEARIARLPPEVEPGFGVGIAPEELERPLSGSLERAEVDELRGLAGEIGTLVRGEIAIACGKPVEAGIGHGAFDHTTPDRAGSPE